MALRRTRTGGLESFDPFNPAAPGVDASDIDGNPELGTDYAASDVDQDNAVPFAAPYDPGAFGDGPYQAQPDDGYSGDAGAVDMSAIYNQQAAQIAELEDELAQALAAQGYAAAPADDGSSYGASPMDDGLRPPPGGGGGGGGDLGPPILAPSSDGSSPLGPSSDPRYNVPPDATADGGLGSFPIFPVPPPHLSPAGYANLGSFVAPVHLTPAAHAAINAFGSQWEGLHLPPPAPLPAPPPAPWHAPLPAPPPRAAAAHLTPANRAAINAFHMAGGAPGALFNHDPVSAARAVVRSARKGAPHSRAYIARTASLADMGSPEHVGAMHALFHAGALEDRAAWVHHFAEKARTRTWASGWSHPHAGYLQITGAAPRPMGPRPRFVQYSRAPSFPYWRNGQGFQLIGDMPDPFLSNRTLQTWY